MTSKHEPFGRLPRFFGDETGANVKTADEINRPLAGWVPGNRFGRHRILLSAGTKSRIIT
jgi:hypothetical protein